MPTFDDGPWVPPACSGSHHAGCHCHESRHRHDLSCERRAKERAQAKLAEALKVIEDVRRECVPEGLSHSQDCAKASGYTYCTCDPNAGNRVRARIAALLPPKEES